MSFSPNNISPLQLQQWSKSQEGNAFMKEMLFVACTNNVLGDTVFEENDLESFIRPSVIVTQLGMENFSSRR